MYYIFEGADGSGKTSIMEEVHLRLNRLITPPNRGKIKKVREPDGDYRKLIMREETTKEEEILLFMADRIRINKEYKPQDIVLSDRSFISSIVYQLIYNETCNIETFTTLLKFVKHPQINRIYIITSDEFHGKEENKYDRVNREEIQNIYKNIIMKWCEKCNKDKGEVKEEYYKFISDLEDKIVYLDNTNEEDLDKNVEIIRGQIIDDFCKLHNKKKEKR